LFGILTEVEKVGSPQPAVGDLFSFRFQVTKEKLTISKAQLGDPAGNPKIEGEYKFVPEKK
ncbi:hypothetical protein ACSTKS_23275, partial [Vibrio parahaemolyticus]